MNRIAPTLMTRDGEMVLGHACKMGLEGIVSKRKDSPYRSGSSPDWIKMKNSDALAVNAKPRRIGLKEDGDDHDESSLHLPRRYLDP
jgi:hypothetical protein